MSVILDVTDHSFFIARSISSRLSAFRRLAFLPVSVEVAVGMVSRCGVDPFAFFAYGFAVTGYDSISHAFTAPLGFDDRFASCRSFRRDLRMAASSARALPIHRMRVEH